MAGRLTDAIMEGGFARSTDKMLDVKYGGQHGWSPKLGRVAPDGKVYSEWISNQAYVRRNVIPVVMQAPLFFKFMPDPEKWVQTLKAMLELHAESIEGLTSGLTVATDEHAVGGAGEMQEEFTNVTRERTAITYGIREKSGKPFQRFVDAWIRYGMMDPDTKTALVSMAENFDADVYTPDYYTATVLFFEPDITHRHVEEAWLCSNMFPKSKGDLTGKRDLSAAGEMLVLSIAFSSITMHNESVRVLAQRMLDKINTIEDDPTTSPTFVTDIDANLNDDAAPYGYAANSAN